MSDYASIHTGIEIDEGITRAMRAVNSNLLDNWYFGNPVDQRGGYVVAPGSPYYNVSDTTRAGTTDKYYPVTKWTGAVGTSNGYITVNGTEYITSYVTRGYTGTGYTIDRWKTLGTYLTTLIQNGSIKLVSKQDYGAWVQAFEAPERFAGKKVRLSFKYKSTVSSSYAQLQINGTWTGWLQFGASSEWKVVGATFTMPEELTSLWVGVSVMNNGDVEFESIKLELGDTQTLAHQENGKWVLNEIPNYAEELAKCQRYQWGNIGERMDYVPIIASSELGGGFLKFENELFPTTMRINPTVSKATVRSQEDGTVTTVDVVSVQSTVSGIFYLQVSPTLSAGVKYQVQFLADANL